MQFERYDQFDIRGYSFDQFIDFVFAHPTPQKELYRTGIADPWYYRAEVECDPTSVIGYYKHLFAEPGFLLTKFSREQLEQAFWLIPGQSLECSAGELIWNESVEFELRADCVRSMFHLYEKLFAIDFLDTSGEMWWDALAYDWHCGNRDRNRGGEDLLMQDVMFETLVKILRLESVNCQYAALHGLGHLHHPETQEAIDAYFKLSTAEDSLRDYAEAAAKFEVL